MKPPIFLVIVAIVAFVFGILFILVPGPLVSLYGISLSAGGQLVGRLFGAALLGYSVLTWSARKAEESQARKAIILAQFIGNTLGFIVALITQFAGTVNALGWSTAVIYFLLALGFCYFQFSKRSAA